MQSNRSRYSSSPTTGMKNKKMWKKIGLFSDQVDEIPDFSSIPVQPTSYQSGKPDFSSVPQNYQENPASFSQPANSYIPYAPYSQQGSVRSNGSTFTQESSHHVSPMDYGNRMGFQQSDQVKPAKPIPQSVVPNPPPSSPQPSSGKMSTAQLVTLFLAVVLPFVFVISFFSNPFFYSFIALALVGAAVMWYRELYSSAVRWIVTGALVLTCFFGVVKLMRMPSPGETTLPMTNPIVIQVQPTTAPVTETEPDLLMTELPSTPVPVVEQTEAEKRLSGFMNLWMSNSIPAMVEYAQPSWVNKQNDPAQSLFNLLANRSVEAFSIESISGSETDTSRSVSMTATINKNAGKKPSVFRFTIMMVKEGDLWYVNPNSLATNDEIKDAADEIVVNDSKASGAATEAPRTTVTPVPPGDTMLYYNPDGGSKYHKDAYCPSVRNEFLPLKGSFQYNELDIYKENYKLSPCMKCNAPVNTLPPN